MKVRVVEVPSTDGLLDRTTFELTECTMTARPPAGAGVPRETDAGTSMLLPTKTSLTYKAAGTTLAVSAWSFDGLVKPAADGVPRLKVVVPFARGWKLVLCWLSPVLNVTGLVVIVPIFVAELLTETVTGPTPGFSCCEFALHELNG